LSANCNAKSYRLLSSLFPHFTSRIWNR
jgi:hypothetical protein